MKTIYHCEVDLKRGTLEGDFKVVMTLSQTQTPNFSPNFILKLSFLWGHCQSDTPVLDFC